MSKTTIPTGGITADAIDATKIADDAISEEHIDATVITASTALAAEPADTDEFLISDAGTIKRIDYSLIKASLTPAFCVRESGHLSFSVSTLATLAEGDVIGGAATITVSDGNSLTSYGGDGGSRIMGFKLIGV